MTSQKIREYFTFNMGKSYTFADVQGTDDKAGETRNSLNACYLAPRRGLLCIVFTLSVCLYVCVCVRPIFWYFI